MKVATVYYVGPRRNHTRYCPSGETYVWVKSGNFGEEPKVEISHLEDAEYLGEHSCFRVEWTGVGKVAEVIDAPKDGLEAMLASTSYRQKQKIAKSLGIKANKSESDLNEALKPAIAELKDSMETN